MNNPSAYLSEKALIAEALTGKINRLIDQRNAIQRLINVLDEKRTRLEKPHLKGGKGNE